MRSINIFEFKGHRAAPTLFLGLFLALCTSFSWAEASQWVAPEDERDEINPTARDVHSIDAGRLLYADNCLTCHGQTGTKGPGAEIMGARLPDLTDTGWAGTETDGSLFYKIAVGKDPMMAYEEYLEEGEIWHIVNFVRTLSGSEAVKEGVEVAAAEAEHQGHGETPAHYNSGNADEHAERASDHSDSGSHEGADEGAHDGAHDAGRGDTINTRRGSGHNAEDAGEAHGGAEAFDGNKISNYKPSGKKAPLAIALVFAIAVGGIISTISKSD